MKKLFITLGLALMAGMSLISCSKGEYNSGDLQTGKNPFSDENTKPKIVPTGNFTAKINGSDFSAAYANAYFTEVASIKSFSIVGSKTGTSLSDGIFLSTTTKDKGTYTIDLMSGNSNSAVYFATGSTNGVVGETGTIEITESTDTRVKGKFSFKAPGGIEVTDGNFDLPVIKYSDYYTVK
jgi:hypothetical protein